jgi:outer membrane protein assembly factor BamB
MHHTAIFHALSLSLLLVTPARPGENWPEFRGPTADGQSRATGLPLTWSETENIRWKTAIHDKGWSSPVVWDKQVWMTTAREDGKELFAVCVDLESGKILHDIKVFDIEKPAFCIAFNSYASPTPAIEAGRVYVHFGSAGTACLDTATGKVLWTRQDLPCDHWRGAGSSPILYKDLLILTFDGHDVQYVAALDKATGKTVWKTDRNIDYTNPDGDLHKAYATPAVIEVQGKPQLICPSAEATLAFDPLTGKEIWRVTHGGMNEASRPLCGHGKVYLTCGHIGRLVAIRPDGSGNITRTNLEWTLDNKGKVPTRPSPLLLGDLLYLVSDGGVASCVEARTGQLVGTQRLQGAFSASPIYADGKMYFPSQEKITYVVKPGPEMKILAANKLDEGCMASPAVAGKAIILRTRTHLYRIEQK